MQQVILEEWGAIDYLTAWQQQEQYMQEALAIKRGEHAHKDTQHRFVLCMHPHVYTLGKSGHEHHLLANEQFLKNIQATFVKTNRGGDITYHGPGQIVGYPILDLEKFTTDLGKYMRNLEQVIMDTLSHFGIQSERLEGATGVWLDAQVPGKARKICAMGVRSSRWVTMHGFALNVQPDLSYFNHIVPCGIADKGVTSMAAEGVLTTIEAVQEILIQKFESVFNVQISKPALFV